MSNKKSRKPVNPQLAQKYQEGYQHGHNEGIKQATMFFRQKFAGLRAVDGIGDKTYQKVKKQLGDKYFT